MSEVLKTLNNGNDVLPNPVVLTASTGQQRRYWSLQDIADESAVSRVFSGGHFNFTTAPSQALGQKVARAVVTGFDQKFGDGNVANLQGAAPQQGRRRKRGRGNRALRTAA